jgi:hypothetical protein
MGRKNQVSVSTARGRSEKLALVWRHVEALKHLDTEASVCTWLVGWALDQWAKNLPEGSLDELLYKSLSRREAAWSNDSDPLAVMSDTAMISREDFEAILRGRQPSDDQVSGLASLLEMDAEKLVRIVQQDFSAQAPELSGDKMGRQAADEDVVNCGS